MGTACKKIGWDDRWIIVDSIGKSGGLLLCWGKDVSIFQIITTSFSIKVEFEAPESRGKMWVVFFIPLIRKESEMSNGRNWYLERVIGGSK